MKPTQHDAQLVSTSVESLRAPQPRRRSHGESFVAVVGLLGLILWAGSPLAAAWILTQKASAVLLEPEKATWVEVIANNGEVSTPASVSLLWADDAPLVAPSWSGIVQETMLSPMTIVKSGDVIAVVDGVSRKAVHTTQPFYRPLALGDIGADATMLNLFLGAQGLRAASSDEVTYETLLGIAEFAGSLGVANAAQVAAFDPAWVVYLPHESVTVDTTSLIVGAPAPNPGTAFAELEPVPTLAVVVARTSAAGAAADSSEITVSPTIKVPPEEELVVGGESISLTEDRTHVSDEGLQILRAAVQPGTAIIDARIVSPAGSNQWIVPAGAIVSDQTGRQCLIVRRADTEAPRDVAVLGTATGTSIVSAELRAGDLVAVRPPSGLRICD